MNSSPNEQPIASTLRENLQPEAQDSADDDRQTLRVPVSTPGPPDAGDQSDTIRFRPAARAPMALLIGLDDGSDCDGERWRLRDASTIIGRNSGTIQIVHDVDMSREHAEISRCQAAGGYSWKLTDLHSTNGTFLRVARTVLRHGKQIILGSRRYEFREGQPANAEESPRETRVYQPPSGPGTAARLIDLTSPRNLVSFPLQGSGELTIGREADRELTVLSDPYLDGCQATLTCDQRQRWVVRDENSTNGLWIRIQGSVPLDHDTEFQLGEQRFVFRLC